MFARSGYLDAKITDIAAEAGRSVGSFYKHFAGKEELLQALLSDWTAQAGQELAAPGGQRPVRGGRAAHPGGRVLAYLPGAPAGDPRPGPGSPSQPRVRPAAGAIPARAAGHHAGAPRASLRAARFDLPGDPAVLASAFNALLEGFCAIWIAGGGEPIGRTLGDDEAISTLTGLLAHGLAGPRRRPPD